MPWLIEIIGAPIDIGVIARFAHIYQASILDVDGRRRLTGTKFDRLATLEEVRTEGKKVLRLLNGLARLEQQFHQSVKIGNLVLHTNCEGQPDLTTLTIPLSAFQIGSYAPSPIETRDDEAAVARERFIANDPRLDEILDSLGDDLTWQRLRVAFEKFVSIIGGSRKNYNPLVRQRYATQYEINRFKANAEDPRLSGIDAVHGVPDGPLKGTKMTVEEGCALIARMFKAYVDRHCSA